jgi:hypothetical protein
MKVLLGLLALVTLAAAWRGAPSPEWRIMALLVWGAAIAPKISKDMYTSRSVI